MNVNELLDTIEDLLEESTGMPLSGGKRIVDVEQIRDYLDDIRANLPVELRQAQSIVSDRAQLIESANAQAQAIVKKAEERARILVSEAQLVEVNDQIQKAKAELVSEQSQYTYYNSVLNSKTNITSVEEVAGRLGLMKMDQSQLTYIRLDSDSVLVRRESAVHQWTDFLHDGAMTILASVRSAK